MDPGTTHPEWPRRAALRAGWNAAVLLAMGGCAGGLAQPPAWRSRLAGDTIALLGEVHDNPEHHRQRTDVLRHAIEAGWRPALVMEQFDLDRQADIDRSRTERPRDAEHLVAQAAGPRSGWDWAQYRPLVALALQYDLPLVAGNLPRAQAMRLAREGYDAVLGAERTRELGLHRAADPAWQVAQEAEIDHGHCGAMPATLLPGLVRAQAARDALMAEQLARHASRGAVLIAGNGHVRRDIGVPRWLASETAARMWTVGYVETGTPVQPGQFDAVVVTRAVDRGDPCEPLRAGRRGG
jgi:uncharacterized iron-regulated protein